MLRLWVIGMLCDMACILVEVQLHRVRRMKPTFTAASASAIAPDAIARELSMLPLRIAESSASASLKSAAPFCSRCFF